MKAVVRLCDRWNMTINRPEDGEPWFADWVLKDPKKSNIRLSAGWHMFRALEQTGIPFKAVQEFFGGIGAQSLMIDELFKPTHHVVQEYTRPAVDHMERELPGWVGVHLEDAYNCPVLGVDLSCLDFGDFTIWKARPGLPHRELLDIVFSKEPRAVTLTDVAGRYLHLHRERYETMLGAGSCGSYLGYLNALSRWIETTFGYTLVRGYWNPLSTKMAFVPEWMRQRGRFYQTPTEPGYFEVLEMHSDRPEDLL